MKFAKRALPIADLVTHLQQIGMGGDANQIARCLRDVGYYRLSPYWRFYRSSGTPPGRALRPDTSIDKVWALYTFDRELRLLVLDAIERVEVGVRSRLVQRHVEAHGPFGYADPAIFAGSPSGHYLELLRQQREELRKAKADLAAELATGREARLSDAVRHFASTYDEDDVSPLWLAAERFSFGDLVTLYKGSPTPIRKATAGDFGIPEPVFESWLLTLQTVRNICAHHGRLWNRPMRPRPKVPDKLAAWKDPRLGQPDRPFFALTILAALVGGLCDGSEWGRRFRALVERRHPSVPLAPMGMVDGWGHHPIWSAMIGNSR